MNVLWDAFLETIQVFRFPVDWYGFLPRVQGIQKVSPKSDPQVILEYVEILLLKSSSSW